MIWKEDAEDSSPSAASLSLPEGKILKADVSDSKAVRNWVDIENRNKEEDIKDLSKVEEVFKTWKTSDVAILDIEERM